jgi:prepilin-type N-terminal cleavage/methylation domain-containing protein
MKKELLKLKIVNLNQISGFSLLEIVIALAIISGGVCSCIHPIPISSKLLLNSAADANVSNLARTECVVCE